MILMFQVLAGVLAAAGLVQAQPQQATTATPDFPEIVARVNGTEIRRSALLNRAAAIKEQLPASQVGADFYQRVLDDMVGGELLYQSVEKKGLAPTALEIDAEVEAQRGRLGGDEGLGKALEAQGLTIDDLRLELTKEVGIQKLIERDFVPTITVSAEEKRKFYDENASSMQRPDQFRAAHILIAVPENAAPETKEEARKKAGALRSLLDSGQDFAELARKNSGDPGSKDSGGELPWMSKGQTVPPFEAAAMALAPGETSGVVETQFGFHIIKLHEKRTAGVMPFEEVEGRIDEFLKRRGLQQKIDTEIQTLKAQGKVEVFI
jgi:peptidyl-prolyl cis-trans isomerase C